MKKGDGCLIGTFAAMGCPCEILFDTDDNALARRLLEIGANEAWRIERKYSRYVDENIVQRINCSHGSPVEVDEETARLLDFADQCHRLSDGLFDITSGILRRAWKFDGSDRLPKKEDMEKIRAFVGWEKVEWKRPVIRLRVGMELDLGGLGKEYAVDRALGLIREQSDIGVLVNFGGDIAVGGKRRNDLPWTVGIEKTDEADQAARIIQVKQGALATSGDSKKFLLAGGKRYGHILDPRSGWPVSDAPRSVTVAAETCTEAGFLSTLGILSGKKSEQTLTMAGAKYWSYQ